jgi:hypothetical protein
MTLKHILAMRKVVVSHRASQRVLQIMMRLLQRSHFQRLRRAVAAAHRRTRRSKRLASCKVDWCHRSGVWVGQEWTAEVLRW